MSIKKDIVKALKAELKNLTKALAILEGTKKKAYTGKKRGPKPAKKRTMSAAARKRISIATTARWAKQKKEKKEAAKKQAKTPVAVSA